MIKWDLRTKVQTNETKVQIIELKNICNVIFFYIDFKKVQSMLLLNPNKEGGQSVHGQQTKETWD